MMYNLDSKTKLKTLNLELEMLKFSQKVDKLENECIRGRAHVKCFGDKVGETRDDDEEQWICWTKDVENGDTKQEEKRKTSEVTSFLYCITKLQSESDKNVPHLVTSIRRKTRFPYKKLPVYT